jgi:hypothetical protein
VVEELDVPAVLELSEPKHDRDQDEGAAVDQGVFVAAGGEAAPLFEPVEGAFAAAPRQRSG